MDFLCQQQEFFKNPNKLPLNELQLEIRVCKKLGKVPKDKDLEKLKNSLEKFYSLKTDKVPALDPCWIQKEHSYHKYLPYCSEVSKTQNDLFIERNKLFLGDLKFLLRCTYHQFWNYLIFEPRMGLILDSFLLNPVPWYEMKHLKDEFLSLYTDIYESVAQVYLRMMNFEASNVEFMSETTVLKYLNSNCLLTYPKMLSLCLLYHKNCPSLLDRIFNIYFSDFKTAPFTRELQKMIDHLLLVFETIVQQVCGFGNDSVIPAFAVRQRPKKFDPYWVEEVATYLLDTAATLNAFLSNCKEGVELGLQMEFPIRLSNFYNKLYPALYEMLQNRANLPYNWKELKERIFNHIGLSRSEFVNVFHVFSSNLIDKVIQTLGDNEKQDDYLESYLEVMISSLENEFFIFDYHSTHHVDLQIHTISDFYPNLDHTRSDYILECLSMLPCVQNVSCKQETLNKVDENVNSHAVACSSKHYNGVSDPTVLELNSQPTSYEVDEKVQLVMEALPHLGDGFILKCLESFNYNTSQVISSILDENLPPNLIEFPRDLIRIPPEPAPEKPILAYKGKKPTYTDAMSLLDDKSDMQGIKEFISKISTQNMYDDDYDDRDGDSSTLPFHDRNDDASVYKHMGNRFEDYELVSDPSDGSSGEEEEKRVPPESRRNRSKGDFCEDPAVVRARYEAGRKYKSRGKTTDVVGKPKGQGQDMNVTRNRDKKTVNKSSKGNHNRKSGAQWKHSRGMLPM